MADKPEKEEGCCSSGCGHCGCAAKVIIALVLLLLGGIVGYLAGSRCHGGKFPMCPMGMSTPAAPTK